MNRRTFIGAAIAGIASAMIPASTADIRPLWKLRHREFVSWDWLDLHEGDFVRFGFGDEKTSEGERLNSITWKMLRYTGGRNDEGGIMCVRHWNEYDSIPLET